MLQLPLPELQVPLSEPQVPLPAAQAAPLGHLEAIEAYVVAYYYAALTNWFCQIHLASIEQGADDGVMKGILDASYRDFYLLDSRLATLDPKEIQANSNADLYQQTRDAWRDCIKDWTTISQAKSAHRLVARNAFTRRSGLGWYARDTYGRKIFRFFCRAVSRSSVCFF